MTKKAQGMSMRTIVIAAIALLVLVVLIMIFTGRIGGFTKDLDSCAAQAGFCYDSDEDPICGSNIVDASGDGKLTEGVDFIVTYPKKGESVKGCAIDQICCHALIP